jgi:arylsulfatase A-like enzyme
MQASLERFLTTERDPKRPFFLFAYYWDPHSHYIPPAPYDAMFAPPDADEPSTVLFHPMFELDKHITRAQLRYLVAQYDGEIRCTDESLGRLWAMLKKLGLWDNTAIVLTSDHGEEFYDHGRNSHKNTVYQESIHVPLILKRAGSTVPMRDSRLVNLIDLYPTILELAGVAITQPHNGHSLLSPPLPERPSFYELQTLWSFTRKSTGESWQESDLWTAVRLGDHKLIHIRNLLNRTGEKQPDRWELYSLDADPKEAHPLSAGHEETIGRLQGVMEEWRESMALLARHQKPGGDAKLSEAEERRLRSLGYLP